MISPDSVPSAPKTSRTSTPLDSDEAFAALLDAALRPEASAKGRVDVTGRVMHRLGYRRAPGLAARHRRLRLWCGRAGQALVFLAAAGMGVAIHNAGPSVVQPASLSVPEALERAMGSLDGAWGRAWDDDEPRRPHGNAAAGPQLDQLIDDVHRVGSAIMLRTGFRRVEAPAVAADSGEAPAEPVPPHEHELRQRGLGQPEGRLGPEAGSPEAGGEAPHGDHAAAPFRWASAHREAPARWA